MKPTKKMKEYTQNINQMVWPYPLAQVLNTALAHQSQALNASCLAIGPVDLIPLGIHCDTIRHAHCRLAH